MIAQVAALGRSFKGVTAYVMHDAGEEEEPKPGTSERVEWTDTRNLASDLPDDTWRIMAATAKAAPGLKRLAGLPGAGRKAAWASPCGTTTPTGFSLGLQRLWTRAVWRASPFLLDATPATPRIALEQEGERRRGSHREARQGLQGRENSPGDGGGGVGTPPRG